MKSIAHHPAVHRNLAATGMLTPPLDGIGDSFAVRLGRVVLWTLFGIAAMVTVVLVLLNP